MCEVGEWRIRECTPVLRPRPPNLPRVRAQLHKVHALYWHTRPRAGTADGEVEQGHSGYPGTFGVGSGQAG